MALTAITPAGQNVVVITSQTELGLYISLHHADENFIPGVKLEEYGDPSKTEEEFHRQLRKEATEKNQYKPKNSTHPEWNP